MIVSLLSAGCTGTVSVDGAGYDEESPGDAEDELTHLDGRKGDGKHFHQLRPAERVPREQFGAVGDFPLGEEDTPTFAFPSLDAEERQSLLNGLAFFTTPHTPEEGLGPINNQTMCLGCHFNSLENVGDGLLTAGSHVARASRATPTNYDFIAFDPITGGGRPADDLDAINGTGQSAIFTIFGDFTPATGAFDTLVDDGGFVQHTRPSIDACLPDPLPDFSGEPGTRRAVGERAAPPYIGRGLMEAVAEHTILLNKDEADHRGHWSSFHFTVPDFDECEGDCISGRPNIDTTEPVLGAAPAPRVGRFGLRAAGSSIVQFVLGGLNAELGFTTELRPDEPELGINADNLECRDDVDGLEVPTSTVVSLQQLIRLTAPPEFGPELVGLLESRHPGKRRPKGTHKRQIQRGAELFGVDLTAFANRTIPGRMPPFGDWRDRNAINQFDRKLNCVGCHTPIVETGSVLSDIGARHLNDVWAPLFSDILLHEGPEVTPEREASTPRVPVVIERDGFATFDMQRSLVDDALPGQGIANGREFRTAPLMGLGVVGAPFLHDGRVFLSSQTVDSTPAGTVYSDRTVTNAPLVVRTLDDAIRAAIELHDLPPPDDERTPANGGCPVPEGGQAGEILYSGPDDICPPYDSELSERNRSEAREVIRRYRSLSPSDQQALIEFLKQL